MSRFPARALDRSFGALVIGPAKLGAAVVAEIELGKVAVKVRFAAMLIDADHAALEHGEHVLNRVRMDDDIALATLLVAECFTVWCLANSSPVSV